MLTTLHAQSWAGWMGDWLRDLAPQWGKVINPPSGFVMPNMANVLVRCWTDDIDAGYIAQGRAGGKAFVQRMWPLWQARPATCYELWNEPDCNTNVGLANLREATIGAVEEAVHLGTHVCVLNCPEGNPHNNNTASEAPTIWKWQQLRPALVAAQQAGMWMGRHCYWRPGVESSTGRWHALGRLAWDLETLAIPGLKVLVNETGIDGGIAGNPGGVGWQRLTTEALYRGEIVEAERFGRTLPGVEALMYFGFGATDQWLAGGFDIGEGFARSLVAPLKALTPPAVETPDRRLIVELARPLAITPSTNAVTQWFGQGKGNYDAYGLYAHQGLDYRCPVGTPVLAAHPGIARAYDQGSMGLGKYVKITYLDGRGVERYVTRVAHLSEFRVQDGARVTRGQVVALSGNTGNSTGAHLHFDLRIVGGVNPGYNDCVDPAPFRTL
jgi:murein DD-endopeptidase MepM/ murein hydrolase activator NlpD